MGEENRENMENLVGWTFCVETLVPPAGISFLYQIHLGELDDRVM